MDEKVSKLPIITVIAAAAGGLLLLSMAQFQQRKEIEAKAVQAIAQEHVKTEAAMRQIAEEATRAEAKIRAAKEEEYRTSPEAIEVQRLDEQDEAEWRAKNHLAPQHNTSKSTAR